MRAKRQWISIGLAAALIAMATLGPGRASADEVTLLSPFCVLCGQRGAADAVANVILFVPLGMALAARWGVATAVFVAAVLSTSVEIAQTGIPGRFPTLGDVLWNTSGAALGAMLWAWRASGAAWVRRRSTAVGAALLVAPAFPILLLGSAPTDLDYFAQWAPAVSERSYDGRVTAASLAGFELPRGRLGGSDEVRAALARGAPLGVSFVAAAPPERPSIVFRIVDAGTHEIVALVVEGNDLIWAERTHADALGLGSPDVAWAGVLEGIRPGVEVQVLVRREGGSLCMRVDTRERCGLTRRLRDGWRLLVPGRSFPGPASLAALWLIAPALLAGIAMSHRPRPALVVLPLVGIFLRILPGLGSDARDQWVLASSFVLGILAERILEWKR